MLILNKIIDNDLLRSKKISSCNNTITICFFSTKFRSNLRRPITYKQSIVDNEYIDIVDMIILIEHSLY